ncbi:MAG: hypothetical protein EBR82_39570 [Caulobacteraceae bacterium]|nr:hypothetical protein [Caulobacteraceae bacterium]
MVLTTATAVVPVDPDTIPEALKARDRWCVWKAEPKEDGTYTKKPMQAGWPSRALSKTTPGQYRSFATAMKAYEGGGCQGVGFVTGDGVVAVDYDECVDEVTREIRSDVAADIERMNTYCEFSPSGRGVRAFLLGKLPGTSLGGKTGGYELFDAPNYVTVTGRQVPGTPDEVADNQPLVEELWHRHRQRSEDAKERRAAERKAERASSAKTAATSSPVTPDRTSGRPETPSGNEARSDEEVLAILRTLRTDADELLRGGWKEYDSNSEADMALANLLAFAAGPNGAAQVERIMLASQPDRAKFREARGAGRTYLSITVDEAYRDTTEFWKPPQRQPLPGRKRRSQSERLVRAIPESGPSDGPVCLTDATTWTDIGLARRLAHEARGTVRYVRGWDCWLSWDGRRWVRDEAGLTPQHIAKKVSDKLWHELAELESNDDKEAATPFVKSVGYRRAIEAAVSLCRSEAGVVVAAEELDRHPYLLNVENGVVDLKTLELRPHAPELLITHMAAVKYDSNAGCPTWRKFVTDVTGGDKELMAFLQRSCGLLLSGDVTEQVLWLHYGQGRNGKSTMLTVLGDLLGSYSGPAPSELLLVKQNNAKELATQFGALAGKRLVTAVEADSGVRFSEATVKLLTGGDTVLARNLYENPWPLKPTWKLHISSNHKPLVRGGDDGIWRRIMLTPWLQRFEGKAEDKRLKDKLMDELPGILNWCLFGFSQWLAGGLEPPANVTEATKEYRGENDIIGQWLNECCVVNIAAAVTVAELYDSYRRWCENRGEVALSSTRLGLELERLGYTSDRPTSGPHRFKTVRRGLGMRSLHHDD